MTAESAASGSAASGDGAREVPLLNIANVLTMSRLVLVPVFLLALFWQGGHDSLWRWVATGIFVVASITDRIDGDIARRRGLVTDFGKVADPIADKALVGAALIGLSVLGDLAWWVTLLIIFRELAVTGLRFWVIRHGVISASPGGKLKTVLQAVLIVLHVVPLGEWAYWPRWVVVAATLLITVGTGVDYLVRAIRLRSSARNGGRA